MVAVTADFVFNRRDLEILPYYRIRHIPWCVRYHAHKPSTGISMLDVDAVPPELYSFGPDWFEYSFVDEEFVVYRQF
jgi:hypothetical protein